MLYFFLSFCSGVSDPATGVAPAAVGGTNGVSDLATGVAPAAVGGAN